jgi:Clostridial hydrophobic W
MNHLKISGLCARAILAALPMLLLACSIDAAGDQADPEGEGLVSEMRSALTEGASVNYPGDRYVHYFSTNGGKCTFQTTPGTLGDTVMWLYGPNSTTNLIAYNDDSGGTLASFIQAYLAPGVYYPTVGGYGSGTGSYQLSMSCSSAVNYRAYIQKYAWLGWGYDGFTAGTVGQSLRMEAIQIQLANMPSTSIRYSVHLGNVGWTGEYYDGQVAGTIGQSRQVEAIKIWLNNAPAGCGVSYNAQVAQLGWMGAVSDGQVAGTTGQGRRLEAIQIWLTGTCN